MGEDVSGFEVRDAAEADLPGIQRLFQRVFGLPLSEEEWRWKFAQNPDGWYSVVAVLNDTGEIVGHYAGWPIGVILDGNPRVAYSVGDVATDPSVRGLGGRRGVYREMIEVFYAHVEPRGAAFSYGFPNARAKIISERVVGTRTYAPVRIVRTDVDAFPAPPPDAASDDFVDESFDPLWETVRTSSRHAIVRDRGRVNWRFHARPSRYYRMLWRRQAGEMIGWAALSAVADGTATVVDYIGREPDGSDLPPLFAAAAAEARSLGARYIAFWESPGGPGRNPIAALPGERFDAGYPFDVRAVDPDAARRFVAGVSFVPSLYDLV
jgi:Acetyltransferase (GNAT) domain